MISKRQYTESMKIVEEYLRQQRKKDTTFQGNPSTVGCVVTMSDFGKRSAKEGGYPVRNGKGVVLSYIPFMPNDGICVVKWERCAKPEEYHIHHLKPVAP